MQLTLETLALLGLGVSNEYLLVLDPNVLYTPHARSLTKLFIYTSFNTRTFGAHHLDQTTEPTYSAQVSMSNVWSTQVMLIYLWILVVTYEILP